VQDFLFLCMRYYLYIKAFMCVNPFLHGVNGKSLFD
jgi:hypothetical protein